MFLSLLDCHKWWPSPTFSVFRAALSIFFILVVFYFFPTLFGFYIFDELFSRIIATLLYQFNDFYSDSTSSISLFGFRRFATLSLISLFYQTISSFFYLFLLLPFIIRKKCRIWRKFNFINRLWLQRLWIFFCHLTMIILHKLDADRVKVVGVEIENIEPSSIPGQFYFVLFALISFQKRWIHVPTVMFK